MKFFQIIFLALVINSTCLFACRADEKALSEVEKKEISSFEKQLYNCMNVAWHGRIVGGSRLAAKVTFMVNTNGVIDLSSFRIISSTGENADKKALYTKQSLLKSCSQLKFPSALKQNYKATFRLIQASNEKVLKNLRACDEFDDCEWPPVEPVEKTNNSLPSTEKDNSPQNIDYGPFMKKVQTCVQNNLKRSKIYTNKNEYVNISWKLDRNGLILPGTIEKGEMSDASLFEPVVEVAKASQRCFGPLPKGSPKSVIVKFRFGLLSRTDYTKGLFEIYSVMK